MADTTMRTVEDVHAAVSAAYGARAREVAAGNGGSCCGDACNTGAAATLYGEVEGAQALPATVVSYGCGNPTAIAALRPGETVLDLGSGAGLDCFLAARQVGAEGHVVGLDMTDDMLALAEENRNKLGLQNVEFRQGQIEAVPLPDAAVDVIISNCVVNLSPDKDAVFREAFRVLRPGGRVHIADVVALRPFTAEEQADLERWSGCISGALLADDYATRLRAAGFTAIDIRPAGEPEAGAAYQSALVTARRPGSSNGDPPFELLDVTAFNTNACCSTDGRCC